MRESSCFVGNFQRDFADVLNLKLFRMVRRLPIEEWLSRRNPRNREGSQHRGHHPRNRLQIEMSCKCCHLSLTRVDLVYRSINGCSKQCVLCRDDIMSLPPVVKTEPRDGTPPPGPVGNAPPKRRIAEHEEQPPVKTRRPPVTHQKQDVRFLICWDNMRLVC